MSSAETHHLKGLEGISRSHQSLPWPVAPVSFLTDSYLWGFKGLQYWIPATSPGSVLQLTTALITDRL